MVIPVPVTIAVCALFGLAYGWVLNTATGLGVYKVSGVRWLDRGLLVWLLGLFAGLAALPALYLAFGFKEFGASELSGQVTQRIRWLARGQIAYLCLYALLVLTTVKQVSR